LSNLEANSLDLVACRDFAGKVRVTKPVVDDAGIRFRVVIHASHVHDVSEVLVSHGVVLASGR
jgi:hypothetical protein